MSDVRKPMGKSRGEMLDKNHRRSGPWKSQSGKQKNERGLSKRKGFGENALREKDTRLKWTP